MSSDQENGEISEPKVLAVEGKDEENFFAALIEHLGLSDIEVRDIAGKTQFASRLEALRIAPGFSQVHVLGVVRDADENPDGAFQSICAALQNADLPVPSSPLHFSNGSPRVIVFIMHDNSSPGMLEDLCLESVESEPAMNCVNEYFECLDREGVSPPANLSKARVQTFLASKPRSGIPLGIAAQKGYWPLDNSAFAQVRDFLQSL